MWRSLRSDCSLLAYTPAGADSGRSHVDEKTTTGNQDCGQWVCCAAGFALVGCGLVVMLMFLRSCLCLEELM